MYIENCSVATATLLATTMTITRIRNKKKNNTWNGPRMNDGRRALSQKPNPD